MKVEIWKRARRLEIGTIVYPSGKTTFFVNDGRSKMHFRFPIVWSGNPATLQFDDYSHPSQKFNPTATGLLSHPRMSVYGAVEIIQRVERRFKMVAKAHPNTVKAGIRHLGLSTAPIIQKFGRYVEATNIFAATEDDLFAIRMCL